MTSKLTREEMQAIISALRLTPTSTVNGISLGRLADALSENEAAMDSEPVAEVVSIYGDPEAFGEREIRPLVGIQQMPYGTKLYRHAQQPVVPEKATVGEMPFLGTSEGVYVRGWNDCRAAMLNHPSSIQPNADAAPGTEIKHPSSNSPVIPGAEQRIADAVELLQKAAPAMLADNSGPDGPLAGRMKSPVIPDGLIAAVNRLLDSDGSRGCYSAISCHDAREEVERLLAAAPQSPGSEPATVPGKWIPVSERVPTKQDGSVFLTWNGQYIGKELFLMGSFQCLKPEIITHWMQLPAGPQEVKGE